MATDPTQRSPNLVESLKLRISTLKEELSDKNVAFQYETRSMQVENERDDAIKLVLFSIEIERLHAKV